MAYIKTTWENEPSESTPLNASNLNKIEEGIYQNSLGVDNIGNLTNLETTNKTTIVGAINELVPTIETGSLIIGNIGICWGVENINYAASGYTGKTITFPFTYSDTNYAILETMGTNFSFFTEIRLSPSDKTTTSCKIGGYNTRSGAVTGSLGYLIIGTISN